MGFVGKAVADDEHLAPVDDRGARGGTEVIERALEAFGPVRHCKTRLEFGDGETLGRPFPKLDQLPFTHDRTHEVDEACGLRLLL